MAKDPILPLYYNDITTSTQDWTDEEFGAYMRLLIHQWRQGGLPKDYQRLTRIATSLSTNWPMLSKKFDEVDGMLKNPVMEEIREKRAKHKQKQKENITKRYQNSTKDTTKKLPLEKETEKEIEKEKEDEDEILNEYQKWSDQIIAGEDADFQALFMNEGIVLTPIKFSALVVDHIELVCRYPKMRPPTQHAFRKSVLKHIRENKDRINLQNHANRVNKNQSHIDSLIADYAKRHGSNGAGG